MNLGRLGLRSNPRKIIYIFAKYGKKDGIESYTAPKKVGHVLKVELGVE